MEYETFLVSIKYYYHARILMSEFIVKILNFKLQIDFQILFKIVTFD